MKSIVMKNNDGRAIMFREDGIFETKNGIPDGIGAVVEDKGTHKKSGRLLRGLVTAAAALVITLGAGTYAYAYTTPYYYVSLDVNPSVQMEANIFGKVIDLQGVNEDGKSVVADVKYKHQNAEKVLTALVQRIGEKGYLANPGDALLIATASKDQKKAAVLEMKLENQAARLLDQEGLDNEIVGGHYGYDMVQQAKAWGMTPGKYNIVTHLLKYTISSQADADNYTNMSVKDLMDIYHQNKDAANNRNDKGQGDVSGGSTHGNSDTQGNNNNGSTGNGNDSSNGNGNTGGIGGNSTDDEPEN